MNAGSVITSYTSTLGCYVTKTVIVNPAPNVYTVTGGGHYCSGATGTQIGLSNSELGIRYQPYNGSVLTGSSMNGVGTPISFGLFTVAGTYSVLATDTTTGCTSPMNGNATVTDPSVAPHVLLSTGIPGAGDTVCLGSLTTFTTQTQNGGTAPTYHWTVNNLPVGTTDSTYQYVPVNLDVLAVKITSNTVCAVPDTATDTIRIYTEAPTVPSVFIQVRPIISISIGESDTLIAVTTNCGPSPRYQWLKNGTPIPGATTNTYISNSFANHDSVTCRVLTSGPCGGSFTFNSVIINVYPAGVTTIANGSDIRLFPNPTTGSFTLKGTLDQVNDQDALITITDMLGQVIYRRNAMTQNGNLNEQISLNNSIANGMYLLEVRSGDETKTFHFVVGK